MTKFTKRKTWWFNNHKKSISVELSGWRSNPGFYIRVDGGEREFTIHFGLLLSIYITFEHFLPKSWYPTRKSDTYGVLLDEKEISLRIHGGSIWWTLWRDPDVWMNKDWRNSSFNFSRKILGDTEWIKCNQTYEDFILPYFEGNYAVRIFEEDFHLKYKRRIFWFLDKKGKKFEGHAGYQEGGVFVEKPVPHEGKGENSWDCGEDCTYSISFGVYQGLHSKADAALEFWKSTSKDRIRYGSKTWLPEGHKDKKIEFLKAKPKPAA